MPAETCTDSPACPCAVCAFIYGPAPKDSAPLQPESRDPERYGVGVCVTGMCVEPCGENGGCKR